MADPLNNSFIPKRGPVNNRRVSASRQVYVFTIISYTLMFATLIAVGGVFIYEKYLVNELDKENEALFNDIKSFKESDMQKVLDFDRRLQQANIRLNNSVSLVSVFQALEASTAETVKIETLSIERVSDEKIALEATVDTDSFDSALFQRKAYGDGSVFSSVMIEDLNASGLNPNVEIAEEKEKPKVTFKAELEVPLEKVPYKPSDTLRLTAENAETVLSDIISASSTAEDSESNDEEI